ncbi:putative aldouronate transport system substrate-binding protein [Stackebrandtia albiflava]|uniref:Putative aldouronate transport system substrate-binding protein n=1 Tax=Stackebrandtia albiflava TaxID=406432 RepID=A0A562UYM0_9ACTN|nr:extracellular solute-binding protein [Stackebrandtia albiflava]TWJ10730.1 putative aldouronate transport system substrate-binding protein [Stackebrandtia albiflava]
MTSLNRRNLLRLGGVAALAGTAGPALVGCGGGGGAGDVGNQGKDLAPYPTYIPFAGPEPDMPGDASGVQPLYTRYPQDVQNAGFDTPGDGSEVRISIVTYGTPPSDLENNKLYQAFNTALGVKLNLTLIPAATFLEKMSTMMTGDDFPDIMMFGGGHVVPREEQFIQANCQDLSDLISGDNIKDYPALANIPPYSWEGLGRIGGRLYGIPTERPIFGGCLMVNRTALEEVGAPVDWTKEDYLAAMRELTAGNKYGVGLTGDFNPDYWAGSMGAPNVWRVEGGKFTSAYTTDEYRDTISMLAQLFAEGQAYPDGANLPATDMKTRFFNQTIACYRDGWGAMGTYAFTNAQGFTPDFGNPFSGGNMWGGQGRYGYVAFKKADEKRIKMLLNICNFLASPFGTKEFELFNYGVEDLHFTRGDDGAPTQTELWETENKTNLPMTYVASAPLVLYYNGYPEGAERVYEWEKLVAPLIVPDPRNGLRSQTWTEKGAELEQSLRDAYGDVIFRGADISAFDEAMQKWMEDGGSQAAAEFEAEYEAANG